MDQLLAAVAQLGVLVVGSDATHPREHGERSANPHPAGFAAVEQERAAEWRGAGGGGRRQAGRVIFLDVFPLRVASDDENQVDVAVVDDRMRSVHRDIDKVAGFDRERVVQAGARQEPTVAGRDVQRGLAVGVEMARAAQAWR